MPELPDITVYVEALQRRILGERLQKVRIQSPFLLRTVEPPLAALENQSVVEVRRLGKRIALGFDQELWLILHLMIAGRLHWKAAAPKLGGKRTLAALDFPCGSLTLTEASSKHRTSLHVLRGEEELRKQDPGGVDVFNTTLEKFQAILQQENHTLKRALTDPRLLSGIGNAYSDEILHRARLSPLSLTKKLPKEKVARLFSATQEVLREWTNRLRAECGDGFPEGVTAFRPQMAVHGKFGHNCPDCGAPIQRIRYAEKETNYCPGCQTEGRLLADRSLSRLLKDDRPKHLDEL